MKQGLVFVLASTMLLTAVASAHVFAPLPDGAPFRSPAKDDTASRSPSPAVKLAVEARQAPVPLQTRERPPLALPPTVETAVATPPPMSARSDSERGSFAKGAIEADGYKLVKSMAPGPDGTWRGRALRGNTEVMLTVDREGRVSAD